VPEQVAVAEIWKFKPVGAAKVMVWPIGMLLVLVVKEIVVPVKVVIVDVADCRRDRVKPPVSVGVVNALTLVDDNKAATRPAAPIAAAVPLKFDFDIICS
jgi:hypothetical protein